MAKAKIRISLKDGHIHYNEKRNHYFEVKPGDAIEWTGSDDLEAFRISISPISPFEDGFVLHSKKKNGKSKITTTILDPVQYGTYEYDVGAAFRVNGYLRIMTDDPHFSIPKP